MSTSGNARHFDVAILVSMVCSAILLLLPPVGPAPARASDNAATLRLTADEIHAEYPAAAQKLIGAYSEIPEFPAGGKSVKLYAFRGTDLVCVAPLKGSQKDKLACWHFDDAPPPVQKIVNDKDAEFADK